MRFEEGRAIARELLARAPESSQAQSDLGFQNRQVAEASQAAGDYPRALAAAEEAVKLMTALSERDPSVRRYRHQLVISLQRRCEAELKMNRLEAAWADFEGGRARIDPLVAEASAERQYARTAARLRTIGGDIARTRRDFATAQTLYREAIAMLEELTRASPNDVDLLENVAETEYALARTLQGSASAAERRRLLDQARDALVPLRARGAITPAQSELLDRIERARRSIGAPF